MKTPARFSFLRPARLLVCLLLATYAAAQSGDTGARARTGTDIPPSRRYETSISNSSGKKYVAGEVLVRFRSGTSKGVRQESHSVVGGQEVRSFGLTDDLKLVRVADNISVETAVAEYRQSPDVLYAEPNYILRAHVQPNDPRLAELWGLNNTGQQGGTPDADIDALEAWNITTGSSSVVIAVIDSGIDYTHPDLAANIFRNAADCNANGVDDDGNGYVDDCHGIDTFDRDSDPMDTNGHGTHVAGTIGATGNNSVGVTGVNWNIQLLPCRFLGTDGFGDTSGAIACLDYVARLKDRGVNIVATNNSWGGAFFSQALEDAFRAQLQRGILAVVSAGNDFADNDVLPAYPASLYLPNIISVAATDRNDGLVSFSNVGRRSVLLGAPGREIVSTFAGGGYATLSGTSMSAPHVSGVVGLLYAQNASRDWRAVKNLVVAGGDDNAALRPTTSGKRLNAFGALNCSGSTVTSRLRPSEDAVAATTTAPVRLSVLNINCDAPGGIVQAGVQPGGATVPLTDDGSGFDQAAGDGIYSAEWTPPSGGSFTLSFPDGSQLAVVVLDNYTASATTSSYRAISGSNLDLTDDSAARVTSPFPIRFGNGNFNELYISSNGVISFTGPLLAFENFIVPNPLPIFVTLVSPFWDDLYPIRGTPQNVFWEVQGVAPNREMVVEWRDVRAFACSEDPSTTVRFQVVFRENSPEMDFNYADATFGGACAHHDRGKSASVGVQVASNVGFAWGNGQMFSSGNETVGDGMSIHWRIAGAPPPPNPAPVLTAISPTTAGFNGPQFKLSVTGSSFLPESRVRWNGSERLTTFIDSSHLEALIPAEDLYFPFNPVPDITVFNPAPGGGTSSALQLTITKPLPAISSITPDRAPAGGLSFRLKVQGSNFHPESSVRWNGQDLLQTVFYSTTELVGLVPLDRIAAMGSAQVTVFSPAPGGGTSNSLAFTIDATPASAPGTISQAIAQPGDLVREMPLPGDLVMKPPRRFYGWNHARSQGLEYLKHFIRPPARNAVPVKNPTPQELGALFSNPEAVRQFSAGSLPGFGIRPSVPAGFIPTGVAAGDFDRDGKTDWVVSNGGSDSLWFYRGRGDGTADPPTIIPLTGQSPVWVVAADLRRNGILDLIVAEADSASVGVLPGNGDGTFGAEVTYFLPAIPLFLLIDDLDGDQIQDVLVGLFSSSQHGPVLLLPGKGDGTFGALRYRPRELTPPFIFNYDTTWISAADADGDGYKDIVIVDFGSAFGAVAYQNLGDGTFKEKQQITVNDGFSNVFYLSSIMEDLNRDGCSDVILLHTLGIAEIFNGRCDGTYDNHFNKTVQPLGVGDVGYGLTLADVNGDLLPDLITSGIFTNVHSLFGQEGGNLLSVMLNDGAGSFGRARIYRGELTAYALAIADLSGDGRPEVITANQDNDSSTVFINDGSGGFFQPEGKHIGWHVTGVREGVSNLTSSKMLARDINGDGHTDLLMVGEGNLYPEPRPIIVMLNDGTGKFSDPIRSPGVDALLSLGDFALGDFRGTGRLDFVSVSSQFGSAPPNLYFAPNLGNGQFGPPVLTHPAGAFGILGAGDFNRDGKLDVVAAFSSATQGGDAQSLAVLIGNGAGGFTALPAAPFGGTTTRWPLAVHTGDFNRDSNPDVLVWLFTNGGPDSDFALYQFLGRGDGTFSTGQNIVPGSGPVTLADFNGDGWLDIVEAKFPRPLFPTPAPAEFKIRLGQSDGSFQLAYTYTPFLPDHILPNFGNPAPVVADFSGDGVQDIAVFQWPRGFPLRAHLQVMLGNGDGSFTQTYLSWPFKKVWAPQFAADVTGDGRADLIELDGYSSSFHVIPATAGSSIQVQLVSDPVIGSDGTLRIILAQPSASATAITLAASDTAIAIPASASVQPGAVSLDVPFQIGSNFDNSRTFTIHARLGTELASVTGSQANPSSLLGFQVFTTFTSQSLQPPQSPTSEDYGLGVLSVEGYASNVSFQCSGLPAGTTCVFGSPSVSFIAGGSANTSLAVTAASSIPPGTYPFTLTASDSARSRQLQLSLVVIGAPDYSLSVSQGSLTVGATSSVSLTVGMNSINNFGGTVSLTCSGLPTGATCAPFGGQPPVLGVSGSSLVFVIQTQSSPVGDYTVTFTGTGGGLTRSISANLKVVDFAVTPPASSSATISVGGSAKFSFSLSSQNGFADSITFSCGTPPVGIPPGIACAFNPPTGNLPAGGTLATEMTVSVNSRPSPSGELPRIPEFPWGRWLWIEVVVLTALLRIILVRRVKSPHLRMKLALASFALVVVCLSTLVSCGGSGGGNSGSPNPPPPPPPPPAPQPVTVSLAVNAHSALQTKTIGTITITVP